MASRRSMSSLAVALNNHSFPDSKQTDPTVEVQRLSLLNGEEEKGISHYRL
ncbi:hypothetical protein F2Q69_00012123 [Brassica cretica]|uniref:Uncharacterized protein n=1 Tax=Brassica cretica TaxID=69181 RepID=A0A8S9QR19_BRACR|nr:hypothetical protein F2Q69_00012123 [Brassica cretica]